MTNIVVEFCVDNDAFRNEDDSLCIEEVKNVFQQAVNLLECGAKYNDGLRDTNGNYCGRLVVLDE